MDFPYPACSRTKRVREDESLRGKPCPWLFPLILILSFLLILHIAWQCSLHSCWWIRQTKSLFISIHFVVTLCLYISLCRRLSVLEFLFLNSQLFSLPFWTKLYGNLRILLHSFVLHIVYRFMFHHRCLLFCFPVTVSQCSLRNTSFQFRFLSLLFFLLPVPDLVRRSGPCLEFLRLIYDWLALRHSLFFLSHSFHFSCCFPPFFAFSKDLAFHSVFFLSLLLSGRLRLFFSIPSIGLSVSHPSLRLRGVAAQYPTNQLSIEFGWKFQFNYRWNCYSIELLWRKHEYFHDIYTDLCK